VRELVIVIADLYWQAGQQPQNDIQNDIESDIAVPPGALPGLTLASRFGHTAQLTGEDWPGWLSRWLGRDDLATLAPGTLAAVVAQAPLPATGSGVWLASPVHLLAGLSSVHLDRRGVLRLPPADLEPLVADFARTFGDSQFRLAVAPPADLILLGPYLQVETVEPARAVLGPLAQALPRGNEAPVLRQLGAEIEMWLHGHAVNQARASRGEPPVSGLWVWGGGTLRGGGTLPASAAPTAGTAGDIAFAHDIRARGLSHLTGVACGAVPDTLGDVLSYAEAQRAALIAEVGPVLQTHPRWTLVEALGALDTNFIAPALQALRSGRLASVVLVANGCSLSLRSKDLRRWWRPRRAPLAGLSA